MSWALACFFGEEWYPQWEAAADHLLRLGEQHEYAWPPALIFGLWAELWNRWCEELRELDRLVLRELRNEAPSFDQIRFLAMAPDAEGNVWLRLPATFDLESPDEHFQMDVMARQLRSLNRACWGAALRQIPAPNGDSRKAGETAPKVGAPPPAPGGTKAPPLLGPTLTKDEMARASMHAPRTKDGNQPICWDAGTNRGCHTADCRNAHVPLGKLALLDATVQMQIARRGGLKGEKRLDANQAAEYTAPYWPDG